MAGLECSKRRFPQSETRLSAGIGSQAGERSVGVCLSVG